MSKLTSITCDLCNVWIPKGCAYPIVDRIKMKELTVCKECYVKNIIMDKEEDEK